MTKKIIFCSIFLFSVLSMVGQTKEYFQDKRHELRLSWGNVYSDYYHRTYLPNNAYNSWFNTTNSYTTSEYEWSMAHLGPQKTTGTISAGYFYHPSWINGRFTVGTSISYSGFSEDIKSSLTSATMGNIKEYNLAFTPSVRYAWIAKPVFQLYSGIGISLYYNDYKANVEMRLTNEVLKNTDLKTSFQVTPLGLSIGKDVFVFGEVNLGGRTGLFVTGGGYRF